MRVYLLICFLFCCCNSFIKESYNVNKNYSLGAVSEYLAYFKKTNGLSSNKLLYLDSLSYRKFIIQVVQERLATYYGSFINDSSEIVKSSFLKENISCIGRILKEIKTKSDFISEPADSLSILIQPNKEFRALGLFYLDNKKPFFINNSANTLHVFLLYGKIQGKLFKRDYNQILDYLGESKNMISLHFISIDVCYNLK